MNDAERIAQLIDEVSKSLPPVPRKPAPSPEVPSGSFYLRCSRGFWTESGNWSPDARDHVKTFATEKAARFGAKIARNRGGKVGTINICVRG